MKIEDITQVRGMHEMVLDALITVLREKERDWKDEAERQRRYNDQLCELHRLEIEGLKAEHDREIGKLEFAHERELAAIPQKVSYWQGEHNRVAANLALSQKGHRQMRELFQEADHLCSMFLGMNGRQLMAKNMRGKLRKGALDSLKSKVEEMRDFIGTIT